jgi:hypothetical protein
VCLLMSAVTFAALGEGCQRRDPNRPGGPNPFSPLTPSHQRRTNLPSANGGPFCRIAVTNRQKDPDDTPHHNRPAVELLHL